MNGIRWKAVVALTALSFLLPAGVVAAAPQAPKRSIQKIAGNLYRYQNNFHFAVFLVTPKGIILTDPINKGVASWLKGELAKRFNQPVRYLIYSHDHQDHTSGGEVFADTATVVTHENAKEAIVGERRPTAVPDVTFSDEMTIELGGKRVELTYVGPSHSNNMIVARFPEERALYICDIVTVKRVGYKTLTDAYFPGWIDALKTVEDMDFDRLVPCHGRVGTKDDVRAQRVFYEDLYGAVLQAARAGKTLAQMKQEIKLEKYKDWNQYKEFLPLNIEGMYKQVQLHRRATQPVGP